MTFCLKLSFAFIAYCIMICQVCRKTSLFVEKKDEPKRIRPFVFISVYHCPLPVRNVTEPESIVSDLVNCELACGGSVLYKCPLPVRNVTEPESIVSDLVNCKLASGGSALYKCTLPVRNVTEPESIVSDLVNYELACTGSVLSTYRPYRLQALQQQESLP